MLSIFETGDASFRLANHRDEDVGWIRGGAVGFDGFASESDAVAAALAGSAALAAFLERQTGASERPARGDDVVRVVHDGAYEWVSRGAVPLARLYRPERDHPQRARRRSFAVEFVLPSYVKAGAAISASQVIHKAIADRPVLSDDLPPVAAGEGARLPHAARPDGAAAR